MEYPFQIIILVIGVIVGFFLKSYLPSYFKKKAENLATKEDIEHITELVENIKSQSEVTTKAYINYTNLKQRVLIEYYDVVTRFNYQFLAVNFGDFPFDKGESLYQYQKDFYKTVTDILLAYQRLVIYLEPDDKLLSLSEQIVKITLDANKVLKTNFYTIREKFVAEQISWTFQDADKTNYNLAVQAANEANKMFWRKMNPINEQYTEKYREFLTKLNIYLRNSGTDD
ncbi:hypothetical protein [Desulfopila sp. IMCC35008]|uniref:hypothetical protein n=1 Tax=Desulfopila sp. IMCC35008 TaxID=2653858 RepID=UPI0013CFDDD0|nr:hypothetical protein [Desulfopila sp. IMCC35008]